MARRLGAHPTVAQATTEPRAAGQPPITTSAAKLLPVFQVSCVTGAGCVRHWPNARGASQLHDARVVLLDRLPLLRRYLSLLPPSQQWRERVNVAAQFHISDCFYVSGVGVVVAGTVHRYVPSCALCAAAGVDTLCVVCAGTVA